jgi:photosystem II stability/assembly factor-like uncharacterized protein
MKILILSFLLLFSLSASSQSWEWLTPIHTNSDLRGCDFLNEQQGCVVSTTQGGLLRTLDGGLTWRRIPIPSIALNLYDVEYLSEDTILVCGNTGNLWRSVDGGTTWADMNPPTTQWLYRLHFVDMNLGFASGFGGTILRTVDGGTTWTVIANPATNRLWDLQFVNDTVGYVVGWEGRVMKTMDTGLTWNTIAANAAIDYQSLFFLDEQTGWIGGDEGTIMKTTNGGQTWTTQYTSTGVLFNYIHFSSPTVGWAAGNNGILLRTTNGGTSWLEVSLAGSTSFYSGSGNVGNASYLFGLGRMYKSLNNGASWSLIKNAVTRSTNSGIFFTDDLHGTVVGYVGVPGSGSTQGGINVTSDGGQTWEIKSQTINGGWYDVHFPTSQIGYATFFNQLAKTTNGGVTWAYTQPTTNTSTLVYFKDPTTGFIGSSSNVSGLCTTTNGGSTFNCLTNISAAGIAFRDANNGIVIPQPGGTAKYTTTDGGITWTTESGGIGGTGIYFYDENLGFITSIGSIYKTTDGGVNWTQDFFGGDRFVGIHFYTPQLGFAVTEYCEIYRSTDGGDNWELFLNGSSDCYALKAVFTENYCYASGGGGAVFRTDLGCDSFSAGEINGDDDWCETGQGFLSIEPVAGAQSYVWELPQGWSGNSSSNTIQVTAGAENGLATVTITNGCGIEYSTSYELTVTQLVQPNIVLNGPEEICSEGTYVFEIAPDSNATSYFWQWTSALTASVVDNVLTVTGATGPGSIYASAENECSVSALEIFDVSIGEIPDVSFISTDDTLCTGTLFSLAGGFPEGGEYSGAGVSNGILDLTGFPDGPTEVSYTYQGQQGCTGSASATIEVVSVLDHPANFNGDCSINDDDVNLLLGSFGCIENCGALDLSGDGIIGVDDIILLMFWID